MTYVHIINDLQAYLVLILCYSILFRPKQSPGRYSTRVKLGNEELSFVQEFRYLGHVMTADCRDDKDIKKTIQEVKCCWEYDGQEVLVCTY